MTRKTQVPGPDGKLHDATKVDVEEATERWSEIKLSDGARVRIKVVVLDVYRLDDLKDATGTPIYSMSSQNVMAVDPYGTESKRSLQ